MVKKIFNLIAGKKKFQNFFHLLLRLAIYGLNIGGGSHSRNSGEINALKYIKAKLLKNEEIIVFDVGANIGEYSVLCFESFKEKSKIFSFEPSHSAFLKFKENTKYIKSIFAINQGLGETGGKMTLYSNKKSSGLASVYKRNLIHFGINMDQMEEISITTIDKVSEENKITSIDFLKLDVEGHEISVLKGATKMISEKRIKFIQFEFGGCNIDSKTYFQDFFYLLNKDFNIYRIIQDGLMPIVQYSELNEIFLTTNYLAELKDAK